MASIAWMELENRTLTAFLKQTVEAMAFVFCFRKVNSAANNDRRNHCVVDSFHTLGTLGRKRALHSPYPTFRPACGPSWAAGKRLLLLGPQ